MNADLIETDVPQAQTDSYQRSSPIISRVQVLGDMASNGISTFSPGLTVPGSSINVPVPVTGLFGRLRSLWDVDTQDVQDRCKIALNPFDNTPFLLTSNLDAPPGSIAKGKRPDMWGPVWLYQTVVFCMFFSTTMAGMLFNATVGSRYEYDVELLTGAAMLMLVFSFVVPLCLWLSIQFFNLIPTLTLAQTLCLYGYSNVVWIPVVLLAGSPLASPLIGATVALVIRALLTLLGFLLSSKFIFKNIFQCMFPQSSNVNITFNRSKAATVIALGVLAHAILAFLVFATFSSSIKYNA